MTLRKALRIEGSLKEMIESSESIKKMFDIASSLEGLVRHASTHAAGIVISDKPLVDQVPLGRSKDESLVTQYPMNDLEEIGLIKYDLLGLNTLTIINKCSKFINGDVHAKPFVIKYIPLNDKKTYDLLSSGKTEGVFQLESFGMRSMIKKMRPKNIDDITALLALYRPGPLGSGMADTYIKRRMYKTKIDIIPQLKDILGETYGVILYQEQVMQIAVKLAGFTPSESDTLRKAMGKKIPEMMAAQKEKFLSGMSKNGISTNTSLAKNIFGQIETFAEYGFNKSHSTAYAIISYRTAYLKANYPVEYMCALMACEMNNNDKIKRYMKECKSMGIKVLPPDINNSGEGFTVHKGDILFGLGAIDGIGPVALKEILGSKKEHGICTSLLDFCLPRNMGKINIKAMTSLIKGGAFDFAHKNHKNTIAVLSYVMDTAKKIQKANKKDTHAEEEIFYFLVG
jgi:DNA polymerase-3 subunit alpha